MSTGLRVELFPSDLDATADFYVHVLGFELQRDQRTAPVSYLALQRGGIRIGAVARSPVDDLAARRPPTGVELVLEVDDLAQELARIAAAGWPLHEGLTRRPWGLVDVRLLDPDGHYLRVTGRAGDDGGLDG